jgi:hypothetical protein
MAHTSGLFQNMINKIFNHIIDLSIMAYINDILIYTQTIEEHEKLIEVVLSYL